MMGMSKLDKPGRLVRGFKTLFFLFTMSLSLLIFSAPVLLVITDAILPSALLSASLSPLSLGRLVAHLRDYEFHRSLIDVPLISLARSIIIFCVYSLCDGPGLSHGPYLAITSFCSVISFVVVSMKACMFETRMGSGGGGGGGGMRMNVGKETWVMEAMLFCSMLLAVGHVVVAYRTSCRERRKLLVYKIDVEAVSAWKKSFHNHHKHQQLRVK